MEVPCAVLAGTSTSTFLEQKMRRNWSRIMVAPDCRLLSYPSPGTSHLLSYMQPRCCPGSPLAAFLWSWRSLRICVSSAAQMRSLQPLETYAATQYSVHRVLPSAKCTAELLHAHVCLQMAVGMQGVLRCSAASWKTAWLQFEAWLSLQKVSSLKLDGAKSPV